MFELSIRSSISSAHFIPGYEGPCKNLHGHTWKIEAVFETADLDRLGMVADFVILKERFRKFLSAIDHVCLNELEYFKKNPPTAEHIAKYVYEGFSKIVQPLKIKRVEVWESEISSVAYCE